MKDMSRVKSPSNPVKEHLVKLLEDPAMQQPSNFTFDFRFRGKRYHYHSETEPHTHSEYSENYWVVIFDYWHPDYVFVYYDVNNERQVVVPRLNKGYKFRIKRLHAVIKPEDVEHFDDRSFWQKRYPNETPAVGELACIFRFKE